jgi:DNA-binding SARP family transcriptional activator
MLDNALTQPVTWISAPAGSGKTTLVVSYLDGRKLPCLWYKVDTGDEDIAAFFYYMRRTQAGTETENDNALPLLAPEYLMGIPVFAKRFFEELYSRLSPPFVIVLDNYQEVSNDSLFQEIIKIGLSSLPSGIKAIVLSRNEPPPRFSGLRSRGGNILGWNDIRCTFEESKDITRLMDRRKLDAETLTLLHNKTEGWVAGLILLIEWSRSKKADYQVLEKTTPVEIFDYFAFEILLKEPFETQIFLLKTAFLPTLTVELTRELTQADNAQKILNQLERSLYFIEKYRNHADAYCYHPLFREFLLSRALEKFDADEITQIRRNAARLLIEDDQIENAADLLLDDRDWEQFIPFVLEQAQSLMMQGRRETLVNWLQAIPHELRDSDPWLLYWLGLCNIGMHPLSARRLFEHAFQLFEARRDDSGALLAWSGVMQSVFFAFDDFVVLDKSIAWLESRMKKDSTFPSREIEVNVSTSMVIALIHRHPGSPGLKEWERKILARSMGAMEVQACLPALPFFAYYYLSIGEFNECAVLVDDMRAMLRTHGSSPLMVITFRLVEALMCTVAAEQYNTGIQSVKVALDLAEKTGVHVLDPLLLAAGVHNALNVFDLETASDFLEKMENTLKVGGSGHTGYYYYLSAWYYLCSGDFFKALAHARKSTWLAEEVGLVFPGFFCRIVLALALHDTGDFPGAKKQLELSRVAAMQFPNTIMEHTYNLLAAHFAFASQEESTAEKALARAMNLGRQKGFATMVNFWRPLIMRDLCGKALERAIEVDYVRDLIRKLKLIPDITAIGTDKWPWPIEIVTLGHFGIKKDGRDLQFNGKTPHKLLMLLQVIIAFGPKGASADKVSATLWPDADGDRANKSLEISLYRLRRLIGGEKLVSQRTGRLGLALDYCRIDAHSFEILLARADEMFMAHDGPLNHNSRNTAQAFQLVEQAVHLYRGPFLLEITETWSIAYKERLRYKYIKAVGKLADNFNQRQEYEKAVIVFEKGLDIDETAESFYHGLMQCHIAQGNRVEALAVYQRGKCIMEAMNRFSSFSEMADLYKKLTV